MTSRPVDKKTVMQNCPICGETPMDEYEPFCSKRCADVDLHRWLSGNYAIPAREEDDTDGANNA